jgi:hypothetical protein
MLTPIESCRKNGEDSGLVRLAELWRISPQARCKRGLMVFQVYHGYMDESGTDDQSKVIAVAGYLSTYELWNRFEEEWTEVMLHYAVTDFHMTDFEAREKEFHWINYWWWPCAEDVRVRFIERVTTICQQWALIGIGCVVIREHYERILTDNIQGALRHPYYFCMYACLNMLLHELNKDQRIETLKPVNFLFDQKKGRFRFGDSKIT